MSYQMLIVSLRNESLSLSRYDEIRGCKETRGISQFQKILYVFSRKQVTKLNSKGPKK